MTIYYLHVDQRGLLVEIAALYPGLMRVASRLVAKRESGSENTRQLPDVEEQVMKRTRKNLGPAVKVWAGA